MKLNLRRRIPVAALLGLFAGLNLAAAPMSPALDGEMVVRGVVFHDTNSNGRREARERVLSNVTVIAQAADAEGGAVNASTVTNAEGQFEIQTRIGDRVSVVPSAGYRALQAAGVIVREGMQEITFPLYVDKVVVDRVIKMEPAEISIPPPQVYVSPQISVPAPVVNVQPAEVHVAPHSIVVQPAPVLFSSAVDTDRLIGTAALFSVTSLLCAGMIARAIRSHSRAVREIAGYRASILAGQMCVNRENWKEIAQQVIADTTGAIVTVEALVSMSSQPVATMYFRAADSRTFAFSLGKELEQSRMHLLQLRRMAEVRHPIAAIELCALWRYFAAIVELPLRLPRARSWYLYEVTYNNCAEREASCATRIHNCRVGRDMLTVGKAAAAAYRDEPVIVARFNQRMTNAGCILGDAVANESAVKSPHDNGVVCSRIREADS